MAGTFQRTERAMRPLLNLTSLGMILLILSTSQEVTSFSVGGRSSRRAHGTPRNMDLAEALALLQRERRRVSDGGYMPSEDLLRSRPLTQSDFSDWLENDPESDVMMDRNDLDQYLGIDNEPTWVSNGNFKEFASQAQTVKPSQKEIEDIFSSDEAEPEVSVTVKKKKAAGSREEKDKKKKRSSPNTERKLVKKSIPSPPEALENENKLSLDTLTQEEFKALMKAVGKLQRQVASDGSSTEAEILEQVSQSDPQQQIAIVQPASKEELQSLFAKEDDADGGSEDDEQDDETTDSDILSSSGLMMEEEVQTPEGRSKVLEVDTPMGGTRLTEFDTPDGQQEVVEETLPDDSMGTLQDVLEDSERELSDALASQLERDISQEAVNEELKAEEEEAEKEVEEEEAAQVESQKQKAAAAAKEEIEREIEANDLAALEKMWISQGNSLPPYPEKRTTKRAARNSLNRGSYSPTSFRPHGIPDDITLERLLTGSDIGDNDDSVDEDIIDSINEGVKEATLEREILNDRDIKNALNAIKNENINKEDIIYGSPLSYPEYREFEEENDNGDEEEEDNENNSVFGISSPDSSPQITSLSAKRSRKFDKERLRELANALSMNSAEDQQDQVLGPSSDRLLSDDDLEPPQESDEVARVFQDLGIGSPVEGHLPDEVAGLPPPLGRFVTRIVELQDEVGQLRAIAQLADLENDVLTDALNEATMAQAPGTVSDMEFESLQQAIWVEKELQKLKQTGGLGELNFVRDDDGNSASAPAATVASAGSKRGEPWRRKRGNLQTGRDRLSQQTFPVASVSRSARPASKDEIEKLLGESYLDRGNSPLNLADLADLADLGASEEDSVASIFLPDANQCPAVREYSTNCELADLYSLPVDYEARALCNLHEMCYACGHSLHVPQESCDEVYRTAAKTLCRAGSACVLEAEIFLRTMKLKTRYVPHKQPTCRSTCTARFLGML
ncbi:hypothetical protein ElyMa_000061100 [Elysia marginata]|uniref:Uncharacterized protein n=1 Tax=Elysia marginata TaxID=1093978 RepID=A0AAV4EHC9_9GAST|nr:hypothetical protein ElyMa_000061100 [Elysia marginata]